MKIILIASDIFFKGGIQRYTRYQYRALTEIFGKENVFLYSFKRKEKESAFEDDINVYYVENYEGIGGKINFTLKILKDIVRLKPSLLLINHVNLAPIGMLIKKTFKIPYYLNVYGLEIWSGLSKLKIISIYNANKIIGDCKFILNYINENLKIEKNRLFLLYDPVDTERFAPKSKNRYLLDKYNIPDDKFKILTVGRLDRFKGHSLIIESLQYLPEDIIYLIVGGGKLEIDLKQKVNSFGLKNRVIFTGRVPESELVEFYNLCDVFVLISKFGKGEGEGLPLTPIEAASCCKPIIVGDEDGSKESVVDGYNGFIISPNKIQILVEKILYLYKNRDILKEMGINARKFVIENFSYEKFKQTLHEVITKL